MDLDEAMMRSDWQLCVLGLWVMLRRGKLEIWKWREDEIYEDLAN